MTNQTTKCHTLTRRITENHIETTITTLKTNKIQTTTFVIFAIKIHSNINVPSVKVKL